MLNPALSLATQPSESDVVGFNEIWLPGHTMLQHILHKDKKKKPKQWVMRPDGEMVYTSHYSDSEINDVSGYAGIDWTFGLGSKAKKEKKKASAEKREALLQQRAENQASREASEKRQLVIQQQKQVAGKAMLVGGVVLALALVGTGTYFAMKKRKKKR